MIPKRESSQDMSRLFRRKRCARLPLACAWLAEVCFKDPEVDGVIITGLFGGYRELLSEEFGPREETAAHQLGKLVRQYRKPLLIQTIYARHAIPALHILREEGIPY